MQHSFGRRRQTETPLRNLVAIAIAVMLALPAASTAQDRVVSASPAPVENEPDAFPSRTLIIGTKEAPPFATKDSDGSWTGISIDLWRQIAEKLGVQFKLVEEPSVQRLIEATARGDYDLSLAAITITAARERSVDFSQPFYNTGLGIAVSAKSVSGWREIVRAMMSFGFLQAAGALIGISLLVSVP